MMIETERLILRPFLESDAEDVYEYLKEPLVNCFACMKLDSVEAARAEVRERSRDTEYTFAIVLKETGKVIGEIDAAPEHTEPTDDYLFREKGARRIYAYTEDYNIPCQHLCEKLGMRREGLFMEFVSFVNNPDESPLYENTYQYAILKKEWH